MVWLLPALWVAGWLTLLLLLLAPCVPSAGEPTSTDTPPSGARAARCVPPPLSALVFRLPAHPNILVAPLSPAPRACHSY